MRKLTFLFALLCVSVMGWAEPYCSKVVTTTIDYTSLDVTVTVKKQDANTVRVILDNEHITGIRAGGTFQQWGNGVWQNQDDAVANFAQGWTQDGNAWYKDFVFSTYPTTGNFQIYILMDHNAGNPPVAGFTLANIDIDNDCSGGGNPTPDSDPEPEGTTFNINTVWPAERVIASKSGDDFNVNIASYGGGQWQGQLKLEHNVSFENTKTYKVGFTLTADKNCGGITFKTDDDQGEVYENQSINLTASTPYHYEKVFKGQAGNNKITVFDFGWVGENTNITISDLTLVEFSPATASSFGGNYIPFLAVDGNTGTRWQAASKGEAWWKMDYGTSQSFNRVNITWENSYAKSFTIQGSNDDESYTTLATISDQTISSFPYKQVIDLDQIYNYRYVKFVGTENGNDYGFSFYEFEIMEVETSVLTSVAITSPRRKTVCPISSSIDITAEARDQYDLPMEGQTITYSVSPASAGTIDANGHYTASQVGEATITASCSDKQATYVVVNTISANLALNKPATAGAYETPIAEANDANLNSYWALGPNKPVEDMWWRVDLEETYDLSLVIIKWEGACPTEHAIQVSSDDTNWTDVATLSGWPEIGNNDDHNYQFYSINAQGRYIRVKASALREVGWGMKMYDFQAFGTVAASPTKSVSAAVNDPAMGSASVTQSAKPVTEVTTGSTVTFSATPNDGYVFVNWSNGETNATFDAVVNSNMNLTANFRALNHICCNEEMTNGDYTAYVTYKKTANDNEYVLIVRSAKEMINFFNAYVGHINGNDQINMNGQGVLSGNGHMLSYTFTSTTEPKMNTPLYINFAGHGEVTFNQINNSTVFEFSQPCEDPEITAIELNKTEATLDMGNTLTLVPTFTPAYMSADITWQTSNASIATVDNGVVTPVAAGNVTITAKVTEDIKATCAVTVQNAASHNWYGYGTDKDLDYTYRIEYTTDHHIVAHVKRQGNKGGLVNAQMLISGAWTYINNTEGEEEGWKKGTTEATFTAGDNIHILIQSNFSGASSIIEFDYEVGSDNVMPTIVPSTLALSNTSLTMGRSDADVQLTAEIHHRDAADQAITWTSDDESVATVENGKVHPVGVGTTTIHATTHNGISASCEVTVVTEIEEANYYGSKTIIVKGNPVGVNYSVTRNAGHTLTYYLSVSEAVDGLVVMQINDGDYHNMESIVTGRKAQWTSTKTYSDGTVHNFFFYLPYANGAGRIDVSYTIGGASEEPNVMIALNDGMANNLDKIAEYDGQIADVVFSREFEDDGFWYTLCLPFDMSAAQLTEAFGAGYTLATLTGSEDRGSILHLNFNYVNTLEAGKPYMFRPGFAVTEENIPTINAVTINNTYVHSVSDHMIFQGTFTNMKLEDENQRFVGPENYLYEPADNGTEIDAFRCYFTIVEGALGLAPGKRARIVFGEQTATGLDNTTVQHPDAAKLMLDGVLYIIREGRTYNAQGILVK